MYPIIQTQISSLLRMKMSVNTDLIAPCNHEESDTRMFLHAKYAALGSIKSVNLVSYDTDILVKGEVMFEELNVD